MAVPPTPATDQEQGAPLEPASTGRYEIEPRNPFFDAVRGMVEREIRPGNTVVFAAQVDLTQIESIRDRLHESKPSYIAFVLVALAKAMREFPYANRRICRGVWPPILSQRLQSFSNCDIAVNVERDIPGAASATFADVLRNADQLSLEDVRRWLKNLATSDLNTNRQWKDFHHIVTRLPGPVTNLLLRLPYIFPTLWVRYRGAAAIVSVPSKYGIHGLVGTWTSPIGVSFGLVRQRPVAEAGKVVVKNCFELVLNFDRRIMAGAQAARFFYHIVNLLENADTKLVGTSEMSHAISSTALPSPENKRTAQSTGQSNLTKEHASLEQHGDVRRSFPEYEIEPNNRFFQAICRMNRFEHRPGNTVTFSSEVDLTKIELLRAKLDSRKPSYTAFVAKAVAAALNDFPYANRRVCRRIWLPWVAPRLQRFTHCDIAIAVERNVPGAESAAFVDIMRDAERMSLTEATDWLRELGSCDVTTNEQWRGFSTVITRFPPAIAAQILRLPYYIPSLWVKYRGGAVLISSPAKYGVDAVVATWSWPIGISFGLVKPRPVVCDGEVVVKPTFQLSMNFDRRVMAGAQAAKFFKCIVDNLEAPSRIADAVSIDDSEGSK